MKRVCISSKDVQWITGKSDRVSRDILSRIKKFYNKQKHQVVTIVEFCAYMGLALEDIQHFFK